MITQCGPQCDVCGKFILPFVNESINPFTVGGIKNQLHACDKCVDIVKDAFSKKDWKSLPEGRLKKAFEEDSHRKEQ